MRLHLLWFLLVVQLATVVTAVTRAPVERLPAWLGQALEVFGEYTGAGNRYSFYAPRPSLPLRVVAKHSREEDLVNRFDELVEPDVFVVHEHPHVDDA